MTISKASQSLLQCVFGSYSHRATVERLKNGAVYYSVGLMKAGTTRANANVEAVYVLVFDDVGTKVDRDMVDVMMPAPTYVIESSPGNFQYGWAITGGCDVAAFVAMRDGAAHRFGASEARAPSNLVRLPEGVNGKAANLNWPVALIVHNVSLRYPLSVLAAACGPGAPRKRGSSGAQRAPSIGALKRTLQGIPNDRGYDYDRWIAVGIAIYGATDGSEEGREAWLDWSNQQPPGEYSAEAKWETFSGTTSSGWGTLEIMAKETVGAAAATFDDGEEPPPAGAAAVPLDAWQQRIAAHIAATMGAEMKWNVSQKKWMHFRGDAWSTVEYDLGFWHAAQWAAGSAAKSSKTAGFAEGVSKHLRNNPGMIVTDGDFNRGLWLGGVPGGEINLVTGALRPGKASSMISKRFMCAPDASVGCPHWLKFLDEATCGDKGMQDFLQRWAGYCLTGDVKKHKFVYLWGPGGNGKSLYVETIRRMMGDYGVQAASDLFVKKSQKGHPDALARLAGARLVVVPEISGGEKWDVDLLKEVTGNDLMVARYMYGANFSFPVTFKIMSTGNHQPAFPGGMNAAIERRFIYGQFENRPKVMDETLADKFTAEMPGIMAWALEGLRVGFKARGLDVPKGMAEATQAYFDETDPVLRWKAECLQQETGAKVTMEDLFRCWQTWSGANGIHEWTHAGAFGKMLRNKGLFTITKPKNVSTVTGWKISKNDPF